MPTLAQLEQEVARRTGPFFQAAQDSTTPTTSTSTAALMPTLRSSAVLGGPENLFLLRRGVRADGTNTVAPVVADDRTRMVQSFDSSAGRVVVDRNWRDPMQPGELADFVHLHPQLELRTVVLAGLRRCFFEDTLWVTPTGGFADTDLTYTAHWITDPTQVVDVRSGYQRPTYHVPFRTNIHQGHVMLTAPIYNGTWVSAVRPHWSWVNGTDSDTGPIADTDTLNVDLDYAASAGHIEAWHLYPNRMQVAAAGGFQASQQMAAAEFTRQALIWGPKRPRAIEFSEVVRIA